MARPPDDADDADDDAGDRSDDGAERPRQRSPADGHSTVADRSADPGTDGPDFDDPLGDLLPRPGVDSRWWYWIAAIPLYVVVGVVFGLLFAVVALAGFGLGLDAGIVGFGLFFVLIVVLGLVGLVLTVLFPVATYVDARAVAASDAAWTPDPLVWGLAALATVVLSAFTLSFVLAVYYLYKRHVAVGAP